MDKHNLLNEFPELATKIHELKITDKHFRKLFDEYHDIDHEIRGIENNGLNTSDEYLDKKRTHRVYLKDELYKILTTN